MRRKALISLGMLLSACLFAPVARAGDSSGFEIGVLAGEAFSSHDGRYSVAGVDEYGSVTTNDVRSEGKASLAYGLSARYVTESGFGFEALWEKAAIKTNDRTTYDLSWMSTGGPQSETWKLSDSGKLDIQPISLNLLWRTGLSDSLSMTFSGGVTHESIDLRDTPKVGLVTYVGDSIETFAADTRARKSDGRTTWNAGLALDLRLTDGISFFVDGRYYADAGREVNRYEVRPGTYAGLHLGQPVTLDQAHADDASAKLWSGSRPLEIDSTIVRAALGVRFRF